MTTIHDGTPVVPDDSSKAPDVVLSYLLGRRLTADELFDAFGVSKSTYYDQMDRGTLITPSSLIAAARNLDLNPVDLLIRFQVISIADIADYLGLASSTCHWDGTPNRTMFDVIRDIHDRPEAYFDKVTG